MVSRAYLCARAARDVLVPLNLLRLVLYTPDAPHDYVAVSQPLFSSLLRGYLPREPSLGSVPDQLQAGRGEIYMSKMKIVLYFEVPFICNNALQFSYLEETKSLTLKTALSLTLCAPKLIALTVCR